MSLVCLAHRLYHCTVSSVFVLALFEQIKWWWWWYGNGSVRTDDGFVVLRTVACYVCVYFGHSALLTFSESRFLFGFRSDHPIARQCATTVAERITKNHEKSQAWAPSAIRGLKRKAIFRSLFRSDLALSIYVNYCAAQIALSLEEVSAFYRKAKFHNVDRSRSTYVVNIGLHSCPPNRICQSQNHKKKLQQMACDISKVSFWLPTLWQWLQNGAKLSYYTPVHTGFDLISIGYLSDSRKHNSDKYV